ncbi:MAG: hypothetical protein MHM6MM_006584, partial [Cercozoa sp. M6MM]
MPEHQSEVDEVCVFVVLGLILASSLQWLHNTWPVTKKLPYTVALFFFGSSFSVLAETAALGNGVLRDAFRSAQHAHPHVILYVLLPPILLYSAITVQ